MEKEKELKSFPRRYIWMDEEEAKTIKYKFSAPLLHRYTDGKKLYVLPGSEDLIQIKKMQDAFEEQFKNYINKFKDEALKNAGDIVLEHEEKWEQKWEEYAND